MRRQAAYWSVLHSVIVMVFILLLFFHLLILPSTLANCSNNTCRSSSCCSESDCISNPLDPDNQDTQTCPCMIPQTSVCVTPGTTFTLACDPGGVCLNHCSWNTPVGTCDWDADSSQCSDSSIRLINQAGTCNIQVLDVQSRHSGVWKCWTVPFTHHFSDYVNITVSTDCTSGTSATWWRSGWTAPVFWVAVVGLVIILIIVVILMFFFCCPWLCLCLPCCAQRNGRLEDRSGRRRSQEDTQRTHRDQRRSTHSPVIVVDDRRQDQMYEQVAGYPSGEGGLGRHRQREDDYNQRHRHGDQVYDDLEFDRRHPNSTVDYDVPRHYSQGGENMRTAKKKSNLATRGLEDRIRKASGVARQEQL